jgi:hypothetical protein
MQVTRLRAALEATSARCDHLTTKLMQYATGPRPSCVTGIGSRQLGTAGTGHSSSGGKPESPAMTALAAVEERLGSSMLTRQMSIKDTVSAGPQLLSSSALCSSTY